LSRNVGAELQFYAALSSRRGRISSWNSFN